MSDSVRPYGQQPTRLLCPQDSLGKNTGMECHFLLHRKYKKDKIIHYQNQVSFAWQCESKSLSKCSDLSQEVAHSSLPLPSLTFKELKYLKIRFEVQIFNTKELLSKTNFRCSRNTFLKLLPSSRSQYSIFHLKLYSLSCHSVHPRSQ